MTAASRSLRIATLHRHNLGYGNHRLLTLINRCRTARSIHILDKILTRSNAVVTAESRPHQKKKRRGKLPRR
jgi:hypothetical protein